MPVEAFDRLGKFTSTHHMNMVLDEGMQLPSVDIGLARVGFVLGLNKRMLHRSHPTGRLNAARKSLYHEFTRQPPITCNK
jgi:hypothetical protein